MPKISAAMIVLCLTIMCMSAKAAQTGDMFSDHPMEAPPIPSHYPEAGPDIFAAPPEDNMTTGSDMFHHVPAKKPGTPQDVLQSDINHAPSNPLYQWPHPSANHDN